MQTTTTLHRYFLHLFILALLLAACDSGQTPDSLTLNPGIAVTYTFNMDAQASSLNPDSALLLWVGTGSAPGQHTPSAPGKLVLVRRSGSNSVVLDLPANTTRVHACGERPTSPDGRYFAVFAGGDNGTLYLMDGVNTTPNTVQTINAMGCLGIGAFQYAPDSRRFGYIAYEQDARTRFAPGTLHIAPTDLRQSSTQFQNVTAFALGAETTAFIQMFAGNNGEFREASVMHWTGSGSASEISTLFAENGCQFRSAQIAYSGEGLLVVLMGQSCSGRGSSWVLYTVDVPSRIAALGLRGSVSGGYYPEARTSMLVTAPDGETAFLTYPGGRIRTTANLHSVSLGGMELSAPLVTNGMMPLMANPVYDPRSNALPLLSPDGRWLALVSNDANNNSALHVIDLTIPDLPPITISAGSRGDTISTMVFTPDSTRLLFVAGGNNGSNNSLFSLHLESAADERIMRGRYAPPLLVSPDGSFAAVVEWQSNSESSQSTVLNLVIISLEDRQSTTMLAEVTGTTSQIFVYPLSWRR